MMESDKPDRLLAHSRSLALFDFGAPLLRAKARAPSLLRKILIGMLVATLLGCATDRPTGKRSMPAPLERTPRPHPVLSTPEAQGMESRQLVEVLQSAQREDIKLHSLIIARNDSIVLQLHVPPYTPETLHNIKSVTKSVLSALTGIAIERGCLRTIDTPLAELLPRYFENESDSRKREITVRHLLTMTAGLDLDENGPKLARILASDDWVHSTLARKLSAPPGEEFLYSSALSHMLGIALSQNCDVSLLELCRASICGALGIERLYWRSDPEGNQFGGADLYLTSLDMLKFGTLYVNDGRHDGSEILQRAWVRESTRNQIGGITTRRVYGFGWWPVDRGYKATGWGGQRIWVVPDKRLVVVATMATHDGFERLFDNFDLERLSDHPLPEDDRATAALRAQLDLWRSPVAHGPSSELAATLGGQIFIVDRSTTTSKLSELSFEFPAEAPARLSIRTDNRHDVLSIGLDGKYRISPTRVLTARGDGRVAARGHWSAGDRFDFELAVMGEPFHLTLSATFMGDSLTLKGVALPERQRISLQAHLRTQDGADAR